MIEFFTEHDDIVGLEVDDEDGAAGAEDALDFAESGGGIGQVGKDECGQGDVDGLIFDGEMFDTPPAGARRWRVAVL